MCRGAKEAVGNSGQAVRTGSGPESPVLEGWSLELGCGEAAPRKQPRGRK